ncbi:hypothetical protein GCM10010299_57940 [Streptomyces tanashiensis]|nr:hypothetical protein GCM10010299_57940 [Streptomyces tanashiensis]
MLHANAYVPAAIEDTYTRPVSDPLDTTPCRRPSASSTNGTLASFLGRAGGTTRAALDLSQTGNALLPCTSKGMFTPERRNIDNVSPPTDNASGHRRARASGLPPRREAGVGRLTHGRLKNKPRSVRAETAENSRVRGTGCPV